MRNKRLDLDMFSRMVAASDPQDDITFASTALGHLRALVELCSAEVTEGDGDDSNALALALMAPLGSMIQAVQEVLDDANEDLADGGADEDTEDS